MTQNILSRRAVLIGGTTLSAAQPLRALAQGAGPAIHVLKDPDCGCCSSWIAHLEEDGFAVSTEASAGAQLARYKIDHGIPQQMASCHTAQVEGYMIEGHVPGMPYGSPGMGPDSAREAYDVFLILRNGATDMFASYGAA